jgi:hypothetical protein
MPSCCRNLRCTPRLRPASALCEPDALAQAGCDGLAGDDLVRDGLDLTAQGLAKCVAMVARAARRNAVAAPLPLLILGGGGYTPANVARFWLLATAAAAGVPVSDTIPEHDELPRYAPSLRLCTAPARGGARAGRGAAVASAAEDIKRFVRTFFTAAAQHRLGARAPARPRAASAVLGPAVCGTDGDEASCVDSGQREGSLADEGAGAGDNAEAAAVAGRDRAVAPAPPAAKRPRGAGGDGEQGTTVVEAGEDEAARPRTAPMATGPVHRGDPKPI